MLGGFFNSGLLLLKFDKELRLRTVLNIGSPRSSPAHARDAYGYVCMVQFNVGGARTVHSLMAGGAA